MTTTRSTVSAASRPSAVRREVPAGRRRGWWGMVLTLGTDLALFACLIASYFYLRFVTSPVWPPDGISEPKLAKPWIMTAILLGSSIPLVVADLGIKSGRRGRLLLWGSVTVLMGLAFLVLQVTEYLEKIKEFDPTTNAYGSMFFAITGFHGLHVAIAVLMLSYVLVAAATGRITQSHHTLVRVVGLYWHTVGAVWIAIFGSLYLAVHL